MATVLEKNLSDSNLSDSNGERGQPLLFWLFLVFNVSAVICSLFVLYHLLSERSSRQALHNHTTIVVLLFNLIYQLVDIPLHLNYFRTGVVLWTNPTLCAVWWFIDYGFFFVNLVLLMWTSLERHILIFHSWMIATQRKRWLVHYAPLLTIVLVLMSFYSVAVFAPPCQNTFDYTLDLCGMTVCYGSVPGFGLTERIGFAIIPMFLIIFLSMALLARVVWQKHRLHRDVEWRKQRKLIVNLVCMSLLYLCFDGPLTIIDLVRLCGQNQWASDVWPVSFYISYFPILLLPMICLGSLTELRKKVPVFNQRTRRRVTAST